MSERLASTVSFFIRRPAMTIDDTIVVDRGQSYRLEASDAFKRRIFMDDDATAVAAILACECLVFAFSPTDQLTARPS